MSLPLENSRTLPIWAPKPWHFSSKSALQRWRVQKGGNCLQSTNYLMIYWEYCIEQNCLREKTASPATTHTHTHISQASISPKIKCVPGQELFMHFEKTLHGRYSYSYFTYQVICPQSCNALPVLLPLLCAAYTS